MNQQLKSYKTVEQIAKKHRMDVSDIQKQLDMGAPIEHEHTKNQKLAVEIALQHLDEFPDYYTRLKKMEADAKKEHKKFKDVKEDAVTDLQRGIVELDDASYDSIDSLMRRIMKKRKVTAKQLHNDFVKKHKETPDTWAKKNMKEETKSGDEGLRDWFGKSKSKDKKPGWVNVVTGGTCASDEPGEGVPKCVSSQKRANMSKEERLSASRRKKTADPGQQEKSGAAKPTNVRTEEMDLQEVKDKPGKGSGKKDACYSKVKSRYDVWPSAYASGALVKCRKVGATNWGTKSEDCWDGYVQKGMKKKGKKMVPNCVPVNSESTDSLGYDWDTPVRERPDRYCPKCEKLETRTECKYGPRYWDMFSLPAEVVSSKKDYNITMPHPGNFPESFDHKIDPEKFKKVKETSVAKKLRRMSTNQQGQLPKEMVKKVLKTDLPRFKEDVTIEDADGNTFIEIIDLIKPEPMKGIGEAKGCGGSPGQEYIDPNKNIKPSKPPKDFRKTLKNIIKNSPGAETPRGSIGEESDQRPFSIAIKKITKRKREGKLTPIQSAKALLQAGKHRTDEAKTFNNFMSEASAAWQRKEGKNPEGGLNKKGIASYRKENPGSNLSLAVTTKPSKLKKGSKKANRRKSFCSRMSGMKDKLTSAKTANDPNSRINKSLRKWNC